MATKADSPVKIERRGNRISVRSKLTGAELAWCFVGDEVATEAIADLLSAKGAGAAAMEFRQAVMDDRRSRRIA